MITHVLSASKPSWQDATDVIIVGSGAAGMSAALRLVDSDLRVMMVTKGELGDGSTAWAQGGLAAVTAPGDSLAAHLEDTLVAGVGLCEPAVVEELVAAAPSAIASLVRAGARFDRSPDGSLALGLEGGHHARRIVHTGDSSGAEVARVLAAQVRQAITDGRIVLLEGAVALDALLTGPPRPEPDPPRPEPVGGQPVSDLDQRRPRVVCGLRVLDGSGAVGEITAGAVVLASGGIGQAWSTTTNPVTATGDGLALALRAGAVVQDLEFVQFHPTVLVVPEIHRRAGDRGVLISEAVRGEGARLIDRSRRPVMAGLHPLGDLAPRDVVSAAMHATVLRSGDDHLFLDATMFGESLWQQHFPAILGLCRDRGIDPVSEPIPVRPAQHYACGGVLADLDGVTTVAGLYAVGEVAATGVQGANRLASNSLTEALIAGQRVGALLADRLHPSSVGAATRTGQPGTISPSTSTAPTTVDTVGLIREAMGRWCGVLRDRTGLTALTGELAGLTPPSRVLDRAGLELINLHTVATATARAAQLRTESRGCHRRADHPETDPRWQRHLALALTRDGTLQELTTDQEIAA